jgi:hypothetical protein
MSRRPKGRRKPPTMTQTGDRSATTVPSLCSYPRLLRETSPSWAVTGRSVQSILICSDNKKRGNPTSTPTAGANDRRKNSLAITQRICMGYILAVTRLTQLGHYGESRM